MCFDADRLLQEKPVAPTSLRVSGIAIDICRRSRWPAAPPCAGLKCGKCGAGHRLPSRFKLNASSLTLLVDLLGQCTEFRWESYRFPVTLFVNFVRHRSFLSQFLTFGQFSSVLRAASAGLPSAQTRRLSHSARSQCVLASSESNRGSSSLGLRDVHA